MPKSSQLVFIILFSVFEIFRGFFLQCTSYLYYRSLTVGGLPAHHTQLVQLLVMDEAN
jgi:hypothetical protein